MLNLVHEAILLAKWRYFGQKTPILGVFSLWRELKDEVIPEHWRSRKQVQCLFEIHRGQNRTTHSGVCSSKEHV